MIGARAALTVVPDPGSKALGHAGQKQMAGPKGQLQPVCLSSEERHRGLHRGALEGQGGPPGPRRRLALEKHWGGTGGWTALFLEFSC